MAEHVLIAGGSGFIGRALVKAMTEHGYLVTVLSRDISNTTKILPQEVQVIDKLSNEKR